MCRAGFDVMAKSRVLKVDMPCTCTTNVQICKRPNHTLNTTPATTKMVSIISISCNKDRSEAHQEHIHIQTKRTVNKLYRQVKQRERASSLPDKNNTDGKRNNILMGGGRQINKQKNTNHTKLFN